MSEDTIKPDLFEDSSHLKSAERDRSTIRFPYIDLEQSGELAIALHNSYGEKCTLDQLAAASGHQGTRSGAFLRKFAAAQIFGLIKKEGDVVSLTAIGESYVDPVASTTGKAEAFLSVELFSVTFNSFKGRILPPDAGLENFFKEKGVAEKQTTVARQVFRRSAEQAGFFKHGKDRLVAPPDSRTIHPSAVENEIGMPPIPDPAGTADNVKVEVLQRELRQARDLILELEDRLKQHLAPSTLPPSIAGVLHELPLSENATMTEQELEDWTAAIKTLVKLHFKSRLKKGE